MTGRETVGKLSFSEGRGFKQDLSNEASEEEQVRLKKRLAVTDDARVGGGSQGDRVLRELQFEVKCFFHNFSADTLIVGDQIRIHGGWGGAGRRHGAG